MLLISGDETSMNPRPRPTTPAMSPEYAAYNEAMTRPASGSAASASSRPGTARASASATARSVVLDGPYADAKEQLGGYYMIDVPDLDEAIDWASPLPGRQVRHDRSPPDLADISR